MFRSEGFKKYLHNTGWLFVDRIVRLASVLITSIFVTRYLGPELFGQLNYASAFVGVLFILPGLGLDEILLRDMVRHPERRDNLLGTAAILKVGGSILLFLVVLALTLVKNMNPTTSTMVLIIAAAEFIKPSLVVEQYFHANTKGRLVAQANMAQALASAAFKLLLIAVHAPLIWFAWAYIVEMVVLAAGYMLGYMRLGASVRAWHFTKATATYLLQQSWPLLVYGLALYVQAKIDQVMIFDQLKRTIGEVRANAEVGQYSAALKMIEALGFLPSIVQTTLAPTITRAKLHSPELYQDRLVNQYRLMFLMFLVTSIPLYFLAEPIMVVLFGEKFRMAGYLLSLFAIRLFFCNMGVGKTSFITNEGLFKYSLITSVVGAVLNITLNFLLIPHYKSIGAIWAMIGSFFVSIFLMDLFFKEARANFRWMFIGIGSFWKVHRAS